MNISLEEALLQSKENTYLDFKEVFNTEEKKDWCEIIKDIISFANTGGGIILFNVDNDGNTLENNIDDIISLDIADISNKIYSYTTTHFSDIKIKECIKDAKKIAAFIIGPSLVPIVFTKEGYYQFKGKDKQAFRQGTVYFRHGAKSETGTTQDLYDFFNRKLEETRESWFSNIRKVIEAPEGYQVQILPPKVFESESKDAIPIKITDDPNAPKYYKDIRTMDVKLVEDNPEAQIKHLDYDKLFPYKSTDIPPLIRKILPKIHFTTYDVWATTRALRLDKEINLYYKSKFSSTAQYSEAYVKHLIDNYNKDNRYFKKAREKYREMRKNGGFSQYIAGYIDFEPKDRIKEKFKIPKDKYQFRVVCKEEIDVVNERMFEVFGIKTAFNVTNILVPRRDEKTLCDKNGFIIEISDGRYISFEEYCEC